MPSYTVHLDCPGLPMNLRIQAEIRYAKSLERTLGGADGVVSALTASMEASESAPEDLRPDTIALARRWQAAADAARQAGTQDIGEVDEAYFEVHIAEPVDGTA